LIFLLIFFQIILFCFLLQRWLGLFAAARIGQPWRRGVGKGAGLHGGWVLFFFPVLAELELIYLSTGWALLFLSADFVNGHGDELVGAAPSFFNFFPVSSSPMLYFLFCPLSFCRFW
jgi:hypothetical protein